MSDIKYPIYKRSKDDSTVIKFVGFQSGWVIDVGDMNRHKVGDFDEYWIPHTICSNWRDLTADEMKEFEVEKMDGAELRVDERINFKADSSYQYSYTTALPERLLRDKEILQAIRNAQKRIEALENQLKPEEQEEEREDFEWHIDDGIDEKNGWEIKNYSKYLLLQDMHRFVDFYAPDWVAGFENMEQVKFGISRFPQLKANTCIHSNNFVFGISCPTQKMAQRMLEIFGERIEEFYL